MSGAPPDAEILTFDRFQPGAVMGEETVVLDTAILDPWLKLFPADGRHETHMPHGMVMTMIMRAYMAVVAPRPPGNVHAGQRVKMHRRPRLGEAVTTRITCEGKEMRKERRWVHLASESRDADGNILFEGRMTLIWAA
ncbi:hotdog family protein [Futiania mangrovi]|uniref:Uncharacterized protein n=1 Tax=Futiania mangrovi TaxID=2959716 RepID=A0A9J6PGS8_9PROT|nr:hypothetical protein [Futiania mangrovii]MCP1337011.1 hypothetical protein [Futiania mangrovii]